MSVTIDSARRRAAANLAAAQIETPDLDARLLAQHAFDLDHTGLALRAQVDASHEALTALDALVRRRIAGEPVARIVGHAEFWSLDLTLAPDTLVPRADTEIVVAAALDNMASDRPHRIADLGTGSGAILIALLSERPRAVGVATDISVPALAMARQNARRHGVGDRAAFVASDFGAALDGGFDLVVSNPPYIDRATLATLAREVRDHDPPRALDGGTDGLDAYRAIASDASRLLCPGGALVLEVGRGQAEAVAHLVRAAALDAETPARPDLSGIPRALVARRPA